MGAAAAGERRGHRRQGMQRSPATTANRRVRVRMGRRGACPPSDAGHDRTALRDGVDRSSAAPWRARQRSTAPQSAACSPTPATHARRGVRPLLPGANDPTASTNNANNPPFRRFPDPPTCVGADGCIPAGGAPALVTPPHPVVFHSDSGIYPLPHHRHIHPYGHVCGSAPGVTSVLADGGVHPFDTTPLRPLSRTPDIATPMRSTTATEQT